MAARRALIVVLAFIGGISIVAAFVPVQAPQDDEDTTSTTTRTESRQAARPRVDGELVRQTVRVDAERPPVIRAETGDQLELIVYSRRPGQVEFGGFEIQEFADRFAPARFDLPLDQPGRFEVRLVEFGDTLATVEVSEPGESDRRDPRPPADGSGAPTPPGGGDADPMAPATEQV